MIIDMNRRDKLILLLATLWCIPNAITLFHMTDLVRVFTVLGGCCWIFLIVDQMTWFRLSNWVRDQIAGVPNDSDTVKVRNCVLHILDEAPTHGYALAKEVKNRLGFCKNLYPILHQLEDVGTLETWTVEEEGRLRRYYKLSSPLIREG